MTVWLNIAEIELAVLLNMCLSQWIPDESTLRRQVEANAHERNENALPVNGVSPPKTPGENARLLSTRFNLTDY